VCLSLFLVSAAGVFAEEGAASPMFVTFNLGVAFGQQLGDSSELAAGTAFGFDFAVIDKLKVGYDGLTFALSGTTVDVYNGLKMSYVVASTNGLDVAADIGFGAYGSSAASTIALGISTNILKSKSESGVNSALNLRASYLSTTENFGDMAALVFIVGYSFGI
jgi:hypothetical protein